jgi:predicted AAA+ superfamily ATPase
VDFIIERKGKLIPIEVKLSAKTDLRQIKGLRSFCDLFKNRISKAYFVNLTEKELKIGPGIFSIPFAEFITGVLEEPDRGH